MLEGGDRTVGDREGSLEMCQDVCCGRLGRQLGGRTALRQRRADFALPLVEAFPDALQGPVTEVAVDSADGGEDRADGRVLEEPPQTGGGQAEASDLGGAPDAEGPPATRSCLAVAAKDSACADGLVSGAAVVKSIQTAMPDQGADNLAMGTRGQFEALRKRVPILGISEKPPLFAHGSHASPKIVILGGRGRCGVVAGYDKNIDERGAG